MAYTPTPWRSNETALSAANMNHIETGIKQAHDLAEDAKAITDDIFNKIYPVGSIYISTSSANPAINFGGTWEQIKDRFLLARGDIYTSDQPGGEATHVLTAEESGLKGHTHNVTIGSHSHGTYNSGERFLGVSNGGDVEAGGIDGSGKRRYLYASLSSTVHWNQNTGSANLGTKTTSTNASSNGVAHNNMPPYLPVFVWQRTA